MEIINKGKVPENLSIRNAPNAKLGLLDLINFIGIDKFKNYKMVEIGSYVGDSTKIFLEYCKEIISVDPYINFYDPKDLSSYNYDMNEIYNLFINKFKTYPNFKHIRKTSLEAAKEFENESLDFIYIDGLHTYEGVKEDILAWENKLKSTSYIAGHDYNPGKFPGVIKAVNELLGEPLKIFNDTSWVIKL